MTSKQRVFSRENDINYHDYTQNKNGIVLLNNAKNKCNNKVLNKFINYNEFLTMTKSYYKYLFQNKCIMTPPKNLYDSNTSYISYKKYIDHISTCDDCNNVNHILNDNCTQLKNVLYPYGLYPTDQNKKIYYPNSIDLKCWCNDTRFTKPLCIYSNSNSNINNNSVWNYSDNNNKNCNNCNNYNIDDDLCKTRKKLFI
jgi:hypothetical protein